MKTQTPDELREEAEVIDAQAEEMREAARALACRAAALRADARELERQKEEPLRALNGRRDDAEHILEILAESQPTTLPIIATILGQGEAYVRTTVYKMIDLGLVERTGLKRGTRYWLAGHADATAGNEDTQRYETIVRDIARKLGTFTIADVKAELPDLAEATLYRWLSAWVEQGALEVARVGNRNIYGTVKPDEQSPTHRPRRSPKPWEAPEGVKRIQHADATGTQRRRYSSREVRDMIRACRERGCQVRSAKHGYVVSLDGIVVTSIPKTASDWRSLENTKADLKRAGVELD